MPEIETQTPPVEGVEPPAPAEEKVVFSEAQQKKLEEIVRKVSARAGSEARAEAERLKAELEAARKTAPVAAPDTSLELATTKAELTALKTAQTENALKDALRAAAGDLFIDSELGTRLMRDSVKIGADGKPVVLAADGTPALNASFEPLSLQELAQRIANEKKFLARSTVRPGAGSVLTDNNFPSGPRLETLFGRASSGAEANRLAMRDPGQYRRLRSQARERGLI